MAAEALLAVLDLVLVVAVARCGGALAQRVGEPRIVGEMFAVILIGPTVLGGTIEGVVQGAAATGVVGALFPALAVDVLTWIGALGMTLYMLLVGLTIDPAPVRRRAGTILALVLAAGASMGVLAVAVAGWLASDGGWKGEATGLAFALALAAVLAAQGVPIVARMLDERGLLRSELGGVVIAAGAGVTTLALLASGVAIHGGDRDALLELATIVAFATILGVAAWMALSRWFTPRPAVAVAVVLLVALAAGAGGKMLIGTVLIGPLIVGIAVRPAGLSAAVIEARLGTIVRGTLFPLFLGVAALHTDLRELSSGALAPALGLVATVVAIKLLATYACARAAGFERREARAIGGLLQCGGVMTIAVSLDVLQAGIITTRMHAVLTLVGLVTTFVAGRVLGGSERGADDDQRARRTAGRRARGLRRGGGGTQVEAATASRSRVSRT